MVPPHEAVVVPCHAVAVDWDADVAFRQPGFNLQNSSSPYSEFGSHLAGTCLAAILVFGLCQLLRCA